MSAYGAPLTGEHRLTIDVRRTSLRVTCSCGARSPRFTREPNSVEQAILASKLASLWARSHRNR